MEFIFMALFILLGFGMAFLSHYIKDPVIFFAGTTIIFIMGLNLFVNGMEIQSEIYEKVNYQYGNNFTYANGSATYHWDYSASGVPPTTDKGVFLFHTYRNETIVYEERKDIYTRGVGLTLTFISIYMYYIIWTLYKKSKY